jgi:hypothetical protein
MRPLYLASPVVTLGSAFLELNRRKRTQDDRDELF